MTDTVDAALGAFGPDVRQTLNEVRGLVHEVAKDVPEIQRVTESLKWGEPSLAPFPKTGTPIRIGVGKDGRPAVFVHCQTSLVGDLAAENPHQMETLGTRGVVVPSGDLANHPGLRGFIRSALTYFL